MSKTFQIERTGKFIKVVRTATNTPVCFATITAAGKIANIDILSEQDRKNNRTRRAICDALESAVAVK